MNGIFRYHKIDAKIFFRIEEKDPAEAGENHFTNPEAIEFGDDHKVDIAFMRHNVF
jgi:hypothetical protein